MIKASMYRVAVHSPTFDKLRQELEEFGGDGDCAILWREARWWKESVIGGLAANYEQVCAIPGAPSFEPRLQRKVMKTLRALSAACKETVWRRLRRWGSTATRENADDVIRLCLQTASHIPSFVMRSFLKTLCGAWCYTGRFRGETRPCVACRAPRSERVFYLLECPRIEDLCIFLPRLPASFCFAPDSAR
eukprot:8683737-Pyramimonas_sp.AAC.1